MQGTCRIIFVKFENYLGLGTRNFNFLFLLLQYITFEFRVPNNFQHSQKIILQVLNIFQHFQNLIIFTSFKINQKVDSKESSTEDVDAINIDQNLKVSHLCRLQSEFMCLSLRLVSWILKSLKRHNDPPLVFTCYNYNYTICLLLSAEKKTLVFKLRHLF